MLRIPNTMPRFNDFLGGYTGLSIYSLSCLGFITLKGYKAQLAKHNMGKIHRKLIIILQESASSKVT